jgi:putative tricarboxylic transport membrane protein
MEGQITSGSLRLLAVTSDERIEGFDAPTLKEAGYDVVLENWHMIAAAPDISDAEKAAIIDDFTKMSQTQEWRDAVTRNNWQDRFLAGEAFEAELSDEIASTREILTTIGLVSQ